MANTEHIALFKGGAKAWNAWRTANPAVRPDFRQANFESDIHTYKSMIDCPVFDGFDLSGADLHMVSARNSIFTGCNFDGARINRVDLCYSHFSDCTFREVEMRFTRIGLASFHDCLFAGSDLSYCSAHGTSFSSSKLWGCRLDYMSLVQADFSNAEIIYCSLYGVSAWDLTIDNTKQSDLVIHDKSGGIITLDNIEIAQFLYLLLNNSTIRGIIDTFTSKVVLILGRFSEDRKPVLERLRTLLKTRGYVPVVFDFDPPSSRDLTETISTLAHLSRFVIADLTDPRSVPHELMSFVEQLPSVPLQPIIAKGQLPYSMFAHLQRYSSVLEIDEYGNDLDDFAAKIVSRCEQHIQDRTK